MFCQEALVDSREGLVLSSTGPRQASHSDDELPATSTTPRSAGTDFRRDETKAVTSVTGQRPKNGVVCRVKLLDGNELQVEIEVWLFVPLSQLTCFALLRKRLSG